MISPTTQLGRNDSASAARSAASVTRVGGLRLNANAGDEHAQLQQAAGKLVAQTFYGTLLKQIRNSPFKSELFSGGKGGESFGQMYDQRLAERMAVGPGRRLANSIVKKIERKSADATATRRA